jgi:hypothetical protein
VLDISVSRGASLSQRAYITTKSDGHLLSNPISLLALLPCPVLPRGLHFLCATRPLELSPFSDWLLSFVFPILYPYFYRDYFRVGIDTGPNPGSIIPNLEQYLPFPLPPSLFCFL